MNKWFLLAAVLMLLANLVGPAVVSAQPEVFEEGANKNLDLSASGVSGIIHVDASATGANNGTSWADAYTSLQTALGSAVSGDQIWVASGTYAPTLRIDPADPRSVAFQMKNGVAVYGGFDPSVGDDGFAERDWESNTTVLSGDIGTVDNNSDNAYHVFYHPDGLNLDNTAVLDGFTLSGGNADGGSDNDCGGGMFNYSSSPVIANCLFSQNSAKYEGGGMYNGYGSWPRVIHCTFKGNSVAYGFGGGMLNRQGSSATAIDCTFSGNSAASSGGGMVNINSSPVVVQCTFSDNHASYTYGGNGGAMNNMAASGGVCNPIVTSCTFYGNHVNGWAGGVFNYAYEGTCQPAITNCTFFGNEAGSGFWGGGIASQNSTPTVTNCIFWGDIPNEVANLAGGTSVVTYSDIQGGYPGTGNINEDPLFVNPGSGNLHLQPDSPCIDAGTNSAPDLPSTDFEGDPRVADGDGDENAVVDMGADEAAGPIEEVVITIGNLTDMTGVSSVVMSKVNMALGDVVAYFNEHDLIPGVQLEVVSYDGQYDPAKDIPGYEWLKGKGADLIWTPVLHAPVTLEPWVEADGMMLFTPSAVGEAVDPPGWVFATDAVPACYSQTLLEWIAENDWDYMTKGPAKIGGALWDEPYGISILDGAEEYCMAHPDQFEWMGGYLTDFSYDWGPQVEALKDCDYVFPPLTLHPFLQQYREAGGKAKLIGTDAHAAFLGIIEAADSWDEIDGMLFVRSSRWWNESDALLDLTMQLLNEHHPGQEQPIIESGSAYLAVHQIYQMLSIIAEAVESVGPLNFDSQALRDAAESFSLTVDSVERYSFSAAKHVSPNYAGIYEANAAGKDLFRLDPAWRPMVCAEPEMRGSISGTVTDSNGDPIAGAWVYASGYDFSVGRGANTAADGSYVISGLSTGSYQVECWADGYIHEYYHDAYERNNATPVPLIAPDETTGIDFTLDEPGSISGTVSDSNGAPIFGANVLASGIDFGWEYMAGTAMDGTYIITGLRSGNYRVKCEAAGLIPEYYQDTYVYNNATPVSVVAANETTGIDFTLDPIPLPATVDISVALQGSSRPNPDGWQIPVTVKFFAPGANVLSGTAVYTSSGTATYVAGPPERAEYAVTGIAPGTYDITVVSEHTLMNVKRNVTITAPSTSVDMGTLLEGDWNGNLAIDWEDLGTVLLTYDKCEGSEGFDPAADFNRNGCIDWEDLGLVLINYDKASPVEIP